MNDLIIPNAIIQEIKSTPQELLIDLATYLYDRGRLSMGKARKLANIPLIVFQQELDKRNICIKYNVEAYKEDLATIERLF